VGRKYVIRFNYSVEALSCKIGGYALRYDNGNIGYSVNWYMMKTIKPGFVYSILDTLRQSNRVITDPVVYARLCGGK
jgi:hypothetical protein